MKIEKIRNYNQNLLAIFGTLGCFFLVLLCIWVIIEMVPSRNYPNNPQGLIADETVESLNQENLRKQIISYDSPWLIDTLNTIYIVPVSIKTLKKPEEIVYGADKGVLLNSSIKIGHYYRRNFNGNYANLIIYSPKEGKTKSLFNERLIIGDVSTYYFKDDILMVFYTASKDTNKNGVIDLEDLKKLCVYSMKSGITRVISDNNNQVEAYQFIESSKDILVTFSLSQYTQKQFDDHLAPRKIMKYSYEAQKLTEIIPQSIQDEMQKWVEGK